ncbi:rifin [Plasmodium falciparum RAJ116]|uniref:Rifin n=1 Tax=Plasmodium falciparum RAJ116 TaxID=580058 RepID=A0A0L0CSI4_PLAFA|nr:rifin [Plasmodium falciparum RAJ116]
MNLHYINMFLFSLMFNILLNVHKNHYNTTLHTPNTTKIPTTRLLCECELYAPPNYNNDPGMKQVMDDFDRQTQQRFHEYEQRMIKNRKECKEQCEKDIQKLILKEKIQKELKEKFSALQIDISTHDIPTCVCEKSVADKTEKFCLKCGYGLGGALTSWEIFGYTGIYGWANYASLRAHEAGVKAGIKAVLDMLTYLPGISKFSTVDFTKMINGSNFNIPMELVNIVKGLSNKLCNSSNANVFCAFTNMKEGQTLIDFSNSASNAGITQAASVQGSKVQFIKTTVADLSYNMIVSGITILIIVLVMVIIYFILRYRRKKKMKKKLQYIKLLKE